MPAVLFIVYFLLLGYLLTRIKSVKDCGITLPTVLILFAIKIASGISVGLVSHYVFNDATDYFGANRNGVLEYHSLISTPKVFFSDIFRSNYSDTGEFFGSKGSYWNDLRFNIIYKILAFTNILSRGNYYINSLFFNFVGFIASVLLFKVLIHIYPAKKWQVIIGIFLLPSTLYFGSGIHKDLIILTAVSVFCYSLYFGLLNWLTSKKILYLLFSFITILFIRNFIAVILLPCALTWVLSKKYKLNATKAFASLIGLGIICTMILHSVSKNLDPLQLVVNRQQAFFALGKANTDFKMDTLKLNITSFTLQAPSALRHSFLSPYPCEFKNLYMDLFSFEMIIYWLLFIAMLFYGVKTMHRPENFVAFGVTFTFLIFLFTGYITPAAGALIRYRSIYLPFLITPILCNIKRLSFLKNNIKFQNI